MKHAMSHTSPASVRKDERKTLEQRRLKAGKLFAKGIMQAEVARCLKVSRTAVHYWYTAWEKKGKAGLISKGTPGTKSWLTEAKKAKVERALLKGPKVFGYATELWTIERITTVIRQVANVSYAPRSAWHILGILGWSCQKPERRSRERDEDAIAHWKKTIWPQIQKKG